MFCNTGASVHNVLRSFRSHKNLRSRQQVDHREDVRQYHEFPQVHTPVPHQRPVQSVAHHPRRPSEASSIETLNSDTSSHQPSTSRRERSIEINPLAYHPPLDDFGLLPGTLRSPPRHHYERQHLGSSGSMSSNSSSGSRHPTFGFRELHGMRSGSVEIHDGFDFGFDNRTPGPGRKPAAADSDDYFGVQPRSHWSRSPSPTPGTGNEEEDAEDPDETPGAGPNPSRRDWDRVATPRSRPLEGLNSPEHFIKRGDWKRRGIVFTPKMPMAGEEKTFDLDG